MNYIHKKAMNYIHKKNSILDVWQSSRTAYRWKKPVLILVGEKISHL